MNKSGLIELYSGIKGYTIFLTNFLLPTGEKCDYILDKEVYDAATFDLVSLIFLGIKEILVEGCTDNYSSLIPKRILEESVSHVADKCDSGYLIDGYLFKDAESVIGTLRNKIAHGYYQLDLKNERFIININNVNIGISIKKFKMMIMELFRCCYYKGNENEVSIDALVISDKNNRQKGLKSKSEIVGFMKKLSRYNFKLKAKDSFPIDDDILSKTFQIINYFEETKDVDRLVKYQNTIKERYEFSWTSKKISDNIIKKASDEFMTINDNEVPYDIQKYFMKEIAKKHLNGNNINLIKSLHKNIMLLDAVYNEQSVDAKVVREKFLETNGEDYIGYEEIASSSIALFETLFCYGNDTFLENKNEFIFLENSGLDYSLLDLSKLNIIYYEDDNTIESEILSQLSSKGKKLDKIIDKINSTTLDLENVLKSNNEKAIEILKERISSLDTEKNLSVNKINDLNKRLNEIKQYKSLNMDHLRNRNIINGIRNSISHGHYFIRRGNSQKEQILVFMDIYEGRITFKCEVDIIDFINMIYENDIIINEFLKNGEEVELCL